MELEQLVIVAVLLVLLGEVTYLVAKLPRAAHSNKKNNIFVDTSALIDGRILAVARSGFMTGELVIPRSVIGELQFLADHADTDKRARARYGLDVVKELQEMDGVNASILQDGSKASEGVDERLLNLAKKHGGAILTVDYNLNKVAVVESIVVLNVNDLAKELRMAYLPGERMMLELTAKGQDGHQAVGHLTDGTMVVVEHANKFIGQSVEVEFIRSLQTAAGKMMFAKCVEKPAAPRPKQLLVKPRGKAPLQPQQAQQAPSKPQQQKPQPQPPKATATYHSDPQEQRRAGSKGRVQGQQGRRQQPRRIDKEDSLIKLVNNQ